MDSRMEFRLSFVWGLNKDLTTSPFGFIKNVAGTAGGVSITHISLGWEINAGKEILNYFATGAKSSASS